jgi:hypothetical protein
MNTSLRLLKKWEDGLQGTGGRIGFEEAEGQLLLCGRSKGGKHACGVTRAGTDLGSGNKEGFPELSLPRGGLTSHIINC